MISPLVILVVRVTTIRSASPVITSWIAVGAPSAIKPKKMMLMTNSQMMIAGSGIPYFLKATPKKQPMVGTKFLLMEAMPVTATMEEP